MICNDREDDYEDFLENMKEELQIEKISYDLAHNIIHASLEFSEEYGFEPHKNFGSAEGVISIESGNIFIPLSMARKLFGNEPAVGKQIMLEGGGGTRTIKAVFNQYSLRVTYRI